MSAVALLGKSAAQPAAPEVVEDDDIAGSGCCSPARSRSSTRDAASAIPPKKLGWFFHTDAGDLGPLAYPDVQLLWKYHLIPENTLVRSDGPPTPIKDQVQYFSTSSQIQHVDPTLLE